MIFRASVVSLRFASGPEPLAWLRIAVCAVILVSPELARAPWLADSGRLIATPEGLDWLASLALSGRVVRVLQILAYVSALTGLVGLWSRTSLAVVTLAGGMCFSFSSREGAVLHDMHLFWLSALLAVSGCGDVWSLDARRRGTEVGPFDRRAPSPRYGVPVSFARLLLGLVYFFPGLAKLRAPGWTDAERVVSIMHGKWLQNGAVPWPRVDHLPWLCALGAVLVVAFELSFVFLALGSRWTRLVAIALGLSFHLVTYRFFFVSFPSLWLCYVVLLEGRSRPRPRTRAGNAAAPLAPALVGAALGAAVITQGIRGRSNAWPFACYPTFVVPTADATTDLVVEAVFDDGRIERRTGREHRVRSQADWGRVYRLAGAYGGAPSADGLYAHARAVFPEPTRELRVYRVAVPTAPERWAEVPGGGTRLATF